MKYRDFWSGKDITRLFLKFFLEDIFQSDESLSCLVSSCFTANSTSAKISNRLSNKLKRQNEFDYRKISMYGIRMPNQSYRHNIWYTGENLRPPINYDLTLSFDSNNYSDTNVFLPYWVTKFEHPEIGFRQSNFTQTGFSQSRSVPDNKRKFCCVVLNNPHPARLLAISALESLGEVDVYGRLVGKPIENKLELLKNYKFNLCFENDLYPNYVTEKIFDAWYSGCIPIYWGMDQANFLNIESFVAFDSYSGIEMLKNKVLRIINNDDAYSRTVSLPLLNKKFDIREAVLLAREILDI
jgi:hypothetical protein